MSCVTVAFLVLGLAASAHALNCGFFHGIGQHNKVPPQGGNPLTDPNYSRPSLPKYWGALHERATKAGCTKNIFYWTTTANRPWNDQSLTREYCAVIDYHKLDVIFTHSMGNNVIAYGIERKDPGCTNIGKAPTQVHWYAIMGPFKGSDAADILPKVCAVEAVGKMLQDNCQKGANGYTVSRSYASLMTGNCQGTQQSTAGAHASGALCGTIPMNAPYLSDLPEGVQKIVADLEKGVTDLGLSAITAGVNVAFKGTKKDWMASKIPGQATAFGTDGMVPLSSCRIVEASKFVRNPNSPYYLADLNHADGRCTYGDDKRSLATQSCAYYQAMIRRSAQIKSSAGARFAQVHDAQSEVEEADAQDQDQDQTRHEDEQEEDEEDEEEGEEQEEEQETAADQEEEAEESDQ